MSKPKVVEPTFKMMDLEPGTYFWCACGESKNQPFCDGSHSGGPFEPRKLQVGRKMRLKMCLCKQTNAPNGVCDGNHFNLDK
ncbi:MAG: CDGSH iron-sulfur domain-containing protein [Bdellovibrionales bacterium]